MSVNSQQGSQRYSLEASAEWVVGFEHPGGKRDCELKETASLSYTFPAASIEEARMKAAESLANFKQKLPGKREGGLSWQNEDAKITSVTFAMILDFKVE